MINKELTINAIRLKGPSMSGETTKAANLGRPRSEQLHQAILTAALDLVLEMGFRVVSIEAIAAKTGIAKTTIYRRWPNKAAVIMEGFLTELRPASFFPEAETALERIRLQMHVTAEAFRGRDGALVKALLAETQFDPDLAEVYRNKWTLPRRKLVIDMLEAAITQGALRPDIDIEGTVDLLYAPIYYRLLLGTGPISDAYIEILFAESMKGLQANIASSRHRKQ